MITAFQAAKKLCSLSYWSISNLRLQKLMYLCHMFHLGKNDDYLIEEPFEAWQYGPVNPEVYQKANIFSNRPVLNVFYGTKTISNDDPIAGQESILIEKVYRKYRPYSTNNLVALTHLADGAWEKTYRRSLYHAEINNCDILQEYKDFFIDEQI
ncbi:hypothetical protein Cva_00856 [Caedimonas varicaedens]|uniref:Antitoxin SocA-like Panacea domain-containing protein n=1 Tax=Caedimonas varicaedens TaxID=1629334 RepID=A0A0K8MDA6_9PROT|nr:hypothetical protein Cva_00856 [Caedimonas varicaedens]